jgi:hypothetical protein
MLAHADVFFSHDFCEAIDVFTGDLLDPVSHPCTKLENLYSCLLCPVFHDEDEGGTDGYEKLSVNMKQGVTARQSKLGRAGILHRSMLCWDTC